MRVAIFAAGAFATLIFATSQVGSTVANIDSTISASSRPVTSFGSYVELGASPTAPITVTTSSASSTEPTTAATYNNPVDELLSTLKANNNDGLAHVADDGIIRDYAANGTVVSAAPLDNTQIRALIDTRPPLWQAYHDHLTTFFANISGYDVVDKSTYTDPPYQYKVADFGGPNITNATLEAEFTTLVQQKHIDTTSVEEKYAAIMEQKKAELDAVEYETSVNPAWQVGADFHRKDTTLWCLGQTCIRHDSCRLMGCRACLTVDLVLTARRVCMGVL